MAEKQRSNSYINMYINCINKYCRNMSAILKPVSQIRRQDSNIAPKFQSRDLIAALLSY